MGRGGHVHRARVGDNSDVLFATQVSLQADEFLERPISLAAAAVNFSLSSTVIAGVLIIILSASLTGYTAGPVTPNAGKYYAVVRQYAVGEIDRRERIYWGQGEAPYV